MKKILAILAVVLMATAAAAGNKVETFTVSNCSTGTVAGTNTTTTAVLGEVLSVSIVLTPASAILTNTIAITALVNGDIAARTILNATNIISSTNFTPVVRGTRMDGISTNGTTIAFPILNQSVQVVTTGFNATGCTANIYLIYQAP